MLSAALRSALHLKRARPARPPGVRSVTIGTNEYDDVRRPFVYKPQHVCFDIETMSTRPNAAIAQIGAYWLDGIEEFPQPGTQLQGERGHQRLSAPRPDRRRRYHLLVAEADRARPAWTGLPHSPSGGGRGSPRFNSWLDLIAPASELEMWSHATFDAVILQDAYRVAGIQPHVPHRQMSDLRTLRYFPEHERIDLKRGAVNEHDAGFDAWAEGQEVVRALRAAGTLD